MTNDANKRPLGWIVEYQSEDGHRVLLRNRETATYAWVREPNDNAPVEGSTTRKSEWYIQDGIASFMGTSRLSIYGVELYITSDRDDNALVQTLDTSFQGSGPVRVRFIPNPARP
ncbi:hypothetical protein FRB99_008227 [Tulasnella sp. 403]|nr:hypothetical protein FRB99_008227 [Tulasnella sp. 403]